MTPDAVFVQKRLPWVSDVSPDAYVMFHGWAKRPGVTDPLRDYRYDEPHLVPFRIKRNLFVDAKVFAPGLNWIVSEEVKRRLDDLPNVKFCPVEFEKVFREPFQVDKDLDSDDVEGEALLDRFEHREELLKELGRWYELIVPSYDDFAHEYGRSTTIATLDLESSSAPLDIALSRGMFESYPIFWKKSNFVAGRIFPRLGDFLDPHFFSWTPISL